MSVLRKNRRHYRVTFEDACVSPDVVHWAVSRPYNGHYRFIHEKAGALVESVIKNHGFVDGNKRTAIYLLNLLLKRSGYRLCASPKAKSDADLEAMILAVAAGQMACDEITSWFMERVEAFAP